MEDLRKKTTVNQNGKNVTVYTEHLPKYVISKKLKKYFFYSLIIGVSFCILKFPYEIGDMIGYWFHSFWTGLSHRF